MTSVWREDETATRTTRLRVSRTARRDTPLHHQRPHQRRLRPRLHDRRSSRVAPVVQGIRPSDREAPRSSSMPLGRRRRSFVPWRTARRSLSRLTRPRSGQVRPAGRGLARPPARARRLRSTAHPLMQRRRQAKGSITSVGAALTQSRRASTRLGPVRAPEDSAGYSSRTGSGSLK